MLKDMLGLHKKGILTLSLLLVLIGCGNHSDLDRWMKAEKTRAERDYLRRHKSIDYTSLQSKGEYYILDAPSLIQPFSPRKMRLSPYPGVKVSGILEHFELSEMRYVGHLKNKSTIKAFVDVNGRVYTVFYGTPIGKNYGSVVKITPEKIVVRETIENFEGLWITRDSEIELSKDN